MTPELIELLAGAGGPVGAVVGIGLFMRAWAFRVEKKIDAALAKLETANTERGKIRERLVALEARSA